MSPRLRLASAILEEARQRALVCRDCTMSMRSAKTFEPSKDARQGLRYGLGGNVAVHLTEARTKLHETLRSGIGGWAAGLAAYPSRFWNDLHACSPGERSRQAIPSRLVTAEARTMKGRAAAKAAARRWCSYSRDT